MRPVRVIPYKSMRAKTAAPSNNSHIIDNDGSLRNISTPVPINVFLFFVGVEYVFEGQTGNSE